jgi:hypothetical protein
MSSLDRRATADPLGQFIAAHRTEIIRRCVTKVARPASDVPEEVDFGIPTFLTQLTEELDKSGSKTREIRAAATEQGHDLFVHGFTASEVVHVYGSVCQSITDLAVEMAANVAVTDFRTLNRCLDDAIAGAVSEYTRQQRIKRDDRASARSTEAKNLLNEALIAFDMIHTGTVAAGGSTGALLRRSLIALQGLL